MRLVERHIIKKNHKFYEEVDMLCLKSKNLYNAANYLVRTEFRSTSKYIHPLYEDSLIRDHDYKKYDNPYKQLPAKVSKSILSQLANNWTSFFRSIKDCSKNPQKYKGKPNLPKYLKKDGRYMTIYDKQAISKKELQHNKIKLSKTNICFYSNIMYDKLKQVRIIPRYGYYVIEVVYEKEIESNKINSDLKMSIDLGVNNLCGIFCETGKTYLINGRPLKSINQYYNKKKAKLTSKLIKYSGKRNSKRLERLSYKREFKIHDYLHKASKKVIDIALENNISTVIIGYNKDWKNDLNIGRINNQKFTYIPFLKLVNMIMYKAILQGIDVILTEESYTSKTDHFVGEKLLSFGDSEKIEFKGKRIFRGLFRSSLGIELNSDINGALGILRKVVPKNSMKSIKGIEGIAVYPLFINI